MLIYCCVHFIGICNGQCLRRQLARLNNSRPCQAKRRLATLARVFPTLARPQVLGLPVFHPRISSRINKSSIAFPGRQSRKSILSQVIILRVFLHCLQGAGTYGVTGPHWEFIHVWVWGVALLAEEAGLPCFEWWEETAGFKPKLEKVPLKADPLKLMDLG